jgi:hypothetical protein
MVVYVILNTLSWLFLTPAIAGGSSRIEVVQPAPKTWLGSAKTRLGSRLSRSPAKPAATLLMQLGIPDP